MGFVSPHLRHVRISSVMSCRTQYRYRTHILTLRRRASEGLAPNRRHPRSRRRTAASLRFRSVSEERDTGLEALLRLVPYFKDLDRVSLARIAGALEPMTIARGTVITREADDAHELYLLESGAITAQVHRAEGSVEVGTVDAPGSFGEMGLLLS